MLVQVVRNRNRNRNRKQHTAHDGSDGRDRDFRKMFNVFQQAGNIDATDCSPIEAGISSLNYT
jgi:hypothetical protein